MRTKQIAAALLLTACGSGGNKDADSGAELGGSGACKVTATDDGSAICYSFSGSAWSASTARDYCETQETSAVTMEWLNESSCPSGASGTCIVDMLSFPELDYTLEMHFYGMTAQAGEETCAALGGEWTA